MINYINIFSNLILIHIFQTDPDSLKEDSHGLKEDSLTLYFANSSKIMTSLAHY